MLNTWKEARADENVREQAAMLKMEITLIFSMPSSRWYSLYLYKTRKTLNSKQNLTLLVYMKCNQGVLSIFAGWTTDWICDCWRNLKEPKQTVMNGNEKRCLNFQRAFRSKQLRGFLYLFNSFKIFLPLFYNSTFYLSLSFQYFQKCTSSTPTYTMTP